MKSSQGRHAARLREVLRLSEHYRATLTLVGQWNRVARQSFEEERAHLQTLTNRELESAARALSDRLRRLRESVGARSPTEEVMVLFEENNVSPGMFGYVPKWVLEKHFSRLSSEIPAVEWLPDYALVQLDVHGLTRDLSTNREYRILDAFLYEDMVVCCNQMLVLEQEVAKLAEQRRHFLEPSIRRKPKELQAMRRGTVTAAFYFVEAYLNGLAFETLLVREKGLAPKDLARLMEWDPRMGGGKGGQKFLSLREKLLHYPRLRAKAAHPLLDENRSPAMKLFLDKAKDLRDAIVHPSPLPNDTSLFGKQAAITFIETGECCEVVDASIALVLSIEEVTFGSRRRLPWLLPRGPDGRFPDEALF